MFLEKEHKSYQRTAVEKETTPSPTHVHTYIPIHRYVERERDKQ